MKEWKNRNLNAMWHFHHYLAQHDFLSVPTRQTRALPVSETNERVVHRLFYIISDKARLTKETIGLKCHLKSQFYLQTNENTNEKNPWYIRENPLGEKLSYTIRWTNHYMLFVACLALTRALKILISLLIFAIVGLLFMYFGTIVFTLFCFMKWIKWSNKHPDYRNNSLSSGK